MTFFGDFLSVLQALVSAVAERLIRRLAAAAQVLLTFRFRRELDGVELGSLVGAVAVGFALGQTAGTPAVSLAGLDLDRNRALGNTFTLGHFTRPFNLKRLLS